MHMPDTMTNSYSPTTISRPNTRSTDMSSLSSSNGKNDSTTTTVTTTTAPMAGRGGERERDRERLVIEAAERVAAEFEVSAEQLDRCVVEFVREMGSSSSSSFVLVESDPVVSLQMRAYSRTERT